MDVCVMAQSAMEASVTPLSLRPQHVFQVGTDSSRCVTCMVAYGQGVWLALQGSAQVRLYHAQSWDSLTEVDVAPAVHKMLSGKHSPGPNSSLLSPIY